MEIKSINLQDKLAKRYHYAKLKKSLSAEVRQVYLDELPSYLSIDGDPNFELYTLSGTHIGTGYERIVIGDYGAFVEIRPESMFKKALKTKIGQEYRHRDGFFRQNVKYFWLTAKDDSDIKIYFQKQCVKYADYKEDMIYICPFELIRK